MLRNFLTICSIILPLISISQIKGDKLYCWRGSMIEVRLSSEDTSKVISKIGYGDSVIFIEKRHKYIWDTISLIINHNHSVKRDTIYSVIQKPNVKVKYKEIEGFVYLGHLGTKPPFRISNNITGDSLLSIDTISRSIVDMDLAYMIQKVYKNGIVKFEGKEKATSYGSIFIPNINQREFFYLLISFLNNKTLEGDNPLCDVIKENHISVDFYPDGYEISPSGEHFTFELTSMGLIVKYYEQGC